MNYTILSLRSDHTGHCSIPICITCCQYQVFQMKWPACGQKNYCKVKCRNPHLFLWGFDKGFLCCSQEGRNTRLTLSKMAALQLTPAQRGTAGNNGHVVQSSTVLCSMLLHNLIQLKPTAPQYKRFGCFSSPLVVVQVICFFVKLGNMTHNYVLISKLK